MARFRIRFALVAVVLLVPTALLVARALRGVGIEREARHRIVADRVFDEMERALSAFLEDEESRPFGHYGDFHTPPGQAVAVRSPLAGEPALPFVIGHFQIDPAGRVTSPRRRPPGAAEPLEPGASARIEEVGRVVAGFWKAGRRPGKTEALRQQAPGSTVELKEREALAAPGFPEGGEEGGAVSAYDALRSLNKGAGQRADRQAKVFEEPAEERRNEVARFELSPMVGERIDAGRLLLYRTALHEERIYRQGLLLDVGALGAWLRGTALGRDGLGEHASVRFVAPDAPVPAVADRFVFQHRFAAPFEDLSARLVLGPLPGVAGAGAVYALGALLLLAVTVGLVAIYRMVAVALRYAEQRSNFVAAVSHELKTPLTAIRMYGEMLRDGLVASEEKRDQYHRHITAETERLTRLVNNVLELSRLENGAPRPTLDTAPLGPVVAEAAELARPHAEAKGFALRVEVEPGLPPVRIERDALLQVLFNLIDNAVKYADGGAPKEIGLAARREGDSVRLTVRDRGPGVPPRHVRRIFEPFYRGENELTRRTKGTGIGLALVRGLAGRMGARVSGRNRSGGGFEVEITFPRADD